MKNCFLLVKTLVVAAVLLIASKSQALHTGYMINASNGLAFYAQTLTDPADAAKAKALSRSLRTLSKPSASTAQDYKLYFSATLQLGQFAFTDPVLNEAGTQLFMAFMMDANVQIQETAARIEVLPRCFGVVEGARLSVSREQARARPVHEHERSGREQCYASVPHFGSLSDSGVRDAIQKSICPKSKNRLLIAAGFVEMHEGQRSGKVSSNKPAPFEVSSPPSSL